MFGKFLKSAKKVQNTQLMQAIVAGCMLIAAADGTIEKPEREKLDKLLTSNDQLDSFKPAEIRKVIQRYENILDADFLVGKQKMLKELSDISDNTEHSEEVFLNMLAISKSDGEVEPAEKDVLLEVARYLGIDASQYGIA